MSLGNDEIAANVRTILDAYLKGIKTRPEDKVIIEAGVSLVTNLLQNINDLAFCALNADQRDGER